MIKKSDDSFNLINYSLRPNKAIARKIVFESLRRISEKINLRSYRFVGMGSIWFVDFILAHRILGISSMVSIENNPIGFSRASFNAPLRCIKMEKGYTSDILPALNLKNHSNIVWLDHDTTITGPAIDDIQILAEQCCEGSIIIITVNADIKKMKEEVSPFQPTSVTEKEISRHLSRKIGDDAPFRLGEKDIDVDNFPSIVRKTLINKIESSLREVGSTSNFIRLFDLIYRDGPYMVTVGGLIGSSVMKQKIDHLLNPDTWGGIVEKPIKVPHLTLREKIALDRLFPSDKPLNVRMVKEKAGFKLTKEQIDSYFNYYVYYPTYAELYL